MAPRNSGTFHIRVGAMDVTALNDGILQGSNEVLAGIDGPTADRRLRESFRAVPPQLCVNGFLIQYEGRTVLVDAGTGSAMGEGVLGGLPGQLEAIGVAADAIDTVLMTHLHIDHAGGLVDGAGRARFPRADLVLHEREHAFWLAGDIPAGVPDQVRAAFDLARRTTAPYGERLRTVTGDVLPGVSIELLPGHTPGHSGYLLQSDGESLLIWGDIVHVPALQFADPSVGVMFDADGAQARQTRARMFARAASERLMVAGMHLEFPAFGYVAESGAGYRFVPVAWGP